MRMPPHLRGRGDGLSDHIRKRQPQSGAGGSPTPALLVVTHREYRRTHSLGSPSDRHGKRPSDSLHQKAYCEQQAASLQ